MHSVTHLIVNKPPHSLTHLPLTLSRPRFLSYRNQSIDLESKLRATGFYMIGISVMKEFVFVLFFFYRGFFSRPFTIHRTAGEGGGHFFNSLLPLLPASQILLCLVNYASLSLRILL